MKKYILFSVLVLNSSVAIAVVPPTKCNSDEIEYRLPNGFSVIPEGTGNYATQVCTTISLWYSMLIADANVPYNDDGGTYVYQDYICVYE